MIEPINVKLILQLGYSIVPTGADKWPTIQWKKYQKRLPTKEEIDSMFPAPGVAIICGKISGNLEVLDFDLKNDLSGTLFDDFMQSVMDHLPDLAPAMVVAESRSKGRHVYYKCDAVEGNKKLAGRHATDQELQTNPHLKQYGLIETRGESGIIVCCPSPGYTWLNGDLSNVPVITTEQRTELLNIARSFNTYKSVIETYTHKVIQPGDNFSVSPWADYNNRGDVLELLKQHGFTILKQQGENVRVRRPGKDHGISGDFNVTKRWFTLFTTSTQFEAEKAYSPAAVYCKLVCNDNWQVLAEKLKADGYGKTHTPIPQDIITKIKNNDFTDDVVPFLEEYKKQKDEAILKFWFVKYNDKKGSYECEIDKPKLKAFLKELGFYLYFHSSDPTYEIVLVENNMVSITASVEIVERIKNYIASLPDVFDNIKRNDLFNLFANRVNLVYEVKNQCLFIDRLEGSFLKDTKDCCYLPYLNGIVEISKSGIKLNNYSQFDKLIWKSSIIKRQFKPLEEFSKQCEFMDFIEFISKDSNKEIWLQRKLSAISIIGYLIHRYKDRINPKAIILMEQCDDPEKGGGTGKGLFMQAIKQIVKVVYKVGKSFDPGNTFAFQDVDLSTAVININDTNRKFRIEDYNSLITDALKTERKNRDSLTLTYDESPKIVFDMNYSIVELAESAQRRIVTYEFSDYFGHHHTPAMEFGHALFYDWDEIEFNRFDNLMAFSVQFWLSQGFVKVDMSEGGRIKAIKQRCSDEFYEWFKEWYESGRCKKKHKLSDLYDEFIVVSMNNKNYLANSFSRALTFACKMYGHELHKERIRELASVSSDRCAFVWIGETDPFDLPAAVSRNEYIPEQLPF